MSRLRSGFTGSVQALALVVFAMMVALPARAVTIVREAETVAVEVRRAFSEPVRQMIPVFVFRDRSVGRAPFLILLHGRAVTAEERAAVRQFAYTDSSRYLAGLGFAVVVPTRVGYGAGRGPDVEDSGPCSRKNYPPAYEAGLEQVDQIVAWVRSRPYVDPENGVIIGQSYGGTLAIGAGSRTSLSGVRAVVNFAGGGGGNPITRPGQPCDPAQLGRMFGSYGRANVRPSLWLYSENDKFMGIEHPRKWFGSFVSAGGLGAFVTLPAYGEDGHCSFTCNPTAWRGQFEAFLRSVGLPLKRSP